MRRPSCRLQLLVGWISAFACTAAAAQPSLTDQLLAQLLNRHTQKKVYEQGDNPWPGGNYKLEVYKNGMPRVTSGLSSIHLQMPLEVKITGNASSSFLQIEVACNSSFTTLGEVELTPNTAGRVDDLTANITLPIPAVVADCKGMKLPIDPYLKAVVAQNKPQWEREINKRLNVWLREGGDGAESRSPSR